MSQPDMTLAPAVERVAYAIGKVIARKTIEDSADLRKLDALGKASALHTLAQRMAPDLMDEARAATDAVLAMLADARAVP